MLIQGELFLILDWIKFLLFLNFFLQLAEVLKFFLVILSVEVIKLVQPVRLVELGELGLEMVEFFASSLHQEFILDSSFP